MTICATSLFLVRPVIAVVLVILVAVAALVALLATPNRATRATPILQALLDTLCRIFGSGGLR